MPKNHRSSRYRMEWFSQKIEISSCRARRAHQEFTCRFHHHDRFVQNLPPHFWAFPLPRFIGGRLFVQICPRAESCRPVPRFLTTMNSWPGATPSPSPARAERKPRDVQCKHFTGHIPGLHPAMGRRISSGFQFSHQVRNCYGGAISSVPAGC